jgi:hypothetical protein
LPGNWTGWGATCGTWSIWYYTLDEHARIPDMLIISIDYRLAC